MNAKHYFSGILVSCSILAISSCGDKQRGEVIHYTKVDSLTETYLDLKDKMLETWNAMTNDDNQKIKAMHDLIHELTVSNPSQKETFKVYQERLDILVSARYTQKSMQNADVVEEYDFASNSLISELISLAESQIQFAYNTTLQKLVETIRTADQRVDNYRQEYDRIALEYNRFLDENKALLKEIDQDSSLDKKPLFRMVTEE